MRTATLVVIGVALAIGVTLDDFSDDPPTPRKICAYLPSPLIPARYADHETLRCPWEASYGFKKTFSGTLAFGVETSKFCPDDAERCKWLRFDGQASRNFPVLAQYITDGPAYFRVRLTGWENLWSGHYGYRSAYPGEVLVDRFETVELISGPIDWSKPLPSRHPYARRNP